MEKLIINNYYVESVTVHLVANTNKNQRTIDGQKTTPTKDIVVPNFLIEVVNNQINNCKEISFSLSKEAIIKGEF